MTKSENNQKVEKKVPKKRGRKPKNKKKEDTAPKIPKKRGRKSQTIKESVGYQTRKNCKHKG